MIKIPISEYNPNINSIWDRLYVGPVGEINRLIDQFNSRYDVNIAITKNLSWKRGSYDKVRAMLSTLIDGYKQRPKNMNHIFELRANNSWKRNSVESSLKEIQQLVWQCRYDGVKLDKETAITYFNDQKSRLDIDIDSIKRLDSESNVEIYVIPSEDNPICGDKLYIDISVNDIMMRVYRDGEFGEEVMATFPMGNVKMKISYNIFQYLNKTSNASMEVCIDPKENIRAHPYIKQTTRSIDVYDHWRNYCMGDFDTSIRKSVRSSDLGAIILLCREWVSNYKMGYTNPLNRPDKWFFGQPETLPKEYALAHANSIAQCSNSIVGDVCLDNLLEIEGFDDLRGRFSSNTRSHVLKRLKDTIHKSQYVDTYENIKLTTIFNKKDDYQRYQLPALNESSIKELTADASKNIVDTCNVSKCKFRHGECKLNYDARYVNLSLTDEEIEISDLLKALVENIHENSLELSETHIKDDLGNCWYNWEDEFGVIEAPTELKNAINEYERALSDFRHDFDTHIVDVSESSIVSKYHTHKHLFSYVFRDMNIKTIEQFTNTSNHTINRVKKSMVILQDAIKEHWNTNVPKLTNEQKLHRQYSDKIPDFENLSDLQRQNAIATIINSSNPF